MPSYTVREDAGELDDLIYIIKEPQGVQTESLLEVELRLLLTGSSTPAEEGLYTTIECWHIHCKLLQKLSYIYTSAVPAVLISDCNMTRDLNPMAS